MQAKAWVMLLEGMSEWWYCIVSVEILVDEKGGGMGKWVQSVGRRLKFTSFDEWKGWPVGKRW